MSRLYELQNVRYFYEQKLQALNIRHLVITSPSRIALIGANGSGKSTLLRLLNGLDFPQEGSIRFDGNVLDEKKFLDESFSYEFRKKVGLLFQDPEVQLFSPTVWDEICYGPLQLQWPRGRILEQAQSILKQFGLEAIKDRPPFRLSLGEKKKVALASILILDPQVLLLDEPTAALDPRTQSVLLELLHQWSERNKTIITSTHDLTILREICDQVYVLQEGEVVHHSSPGDVLENQELLERTNLIHVHTHRHRELVHFHPHTHDFHAHAHNHEDKKTNTDTENE